MVKPHARKAFFEFMAGWSIYVKNPKHFGWRLTLPEIPEPEVFEHPIPMTDEQREFVFNATADGGGQASMFEVEKLNTIQRAKYSQAAKGFVYLKGDKGVKRINSLKPDFIAELIATEQRAGLQVLVWTTFDEECTVLREALGRLPAFKRPSLDEVAILTGKTPDTKRLEMLDGYRDGRVPILISRASMLGYGHEPAMHRIDDLQRVERFV
jgi:hypothetical protein